jgi:integrase
VTGRLRQRRKSLGTISRAAAKAKADELAARFATLGPSTAPAPLTLQALFDSYGQEVTPHKGRTARSHDRMCREMFCRYFGADRAPYTLSRREWDRFINDRRRGAIGPVHGRKQPVRDRVIAYDLAHLVALLNWATMAGDARGGVLLDRNPLKGLPLPKEASPKRAVVTAEQYTALRTAAAKRGPLVELVLIICHDTGHRIGSVRRLRWSDVDADRRTVHWRGEYDKLGKDHATPLTDDAVAALNKVRRTQAAIGDGWIFPAPGDPTQHWSRAAAERKWKWLAKRAGLPTDERYGWHSLRRQFATELKHIPLTDLCALGRWKSSQTILTCYQQPDERTQRTALAQRKLLDVGGLR